MDQIVVVGGDNSQPKASVSEEPVAAPQAIAVTTQSTSEQQPVPDAQKPEAPTLPSGEAVEPATVEPPDAAAVSWTASEFIAHHKSIRWYLSLGSAAVLVLAAVWFVTKDVFAVVTIAIGLGLLGFYATHKPRQQSYSLDSSGLTIGDRRYRFNEFRSFSLIPEGAFLSIELAPLKRFATFTTVYFDPADEGRIVGLLSAHLPTAPPRGDLTDQLMRRIRF